MAPPGPSSGTHVSPALGWAVGGRSWRGARIGTRGLGRGHPCLDGTGCVWPEGCPVRPPFAGPAYRSVERVTWRVWISSACAVGGGAGGRSFAYRPPWAGDSGDSEVGRQRRASLAATLGLSMADVPGSTSSGRSQHVRSSSHARCRDACPRGCPGGTARGPQDPPPDRRGDPPVGELRVRVGPVALSRSRGRGGTGCDGPRVCGCCRGGRQRGEECSAGSVRDRFVLCLRQHLRDLPGRLSVVLRPPRVGGRSAGAVHARSARRRHAGRHL